VSFSEPVSNRHLESVYFIVAVICLLVKTEICSALSARLLEETQPFEREKVTDDRTLPWNMIQKQNTTVSNEKDQTH
jgi:hypothetical protein